MLSGDRDTYQLVSDVTATLHPRPRGVLERIDRAGVRERYGVEPEQVTSLIALRGDPSDNIPGAQGHRCEDAPPSCCGATATSRA